MEKSAMIIPAGYLAKSTNKSLNHWYLKTTGRREKIPVIRVIEIIDVKSGSEMYLQLKNKLVNDYILRYEWKNVLGGQMPKKETIFSGKLIRE